MSRPQLTLDGNEAAARVAYQVSDVVAIYPITPASPMGEWADQWSTLNVENIWGSVPDVVEMQSEAGAAGAVHGSLQAGALTTTFTASQGLLLMIPNMYKIAGELTPAVIHIAARSLAAQALSIFGDHSDVMSARGTGFAMLASCSVQESMDMALIAHTATLESRIPFMHFFDGFRTSHELMKIEAVTADDVRAMIKPEWVHAFRERALTPDKPVLRGTAQNPDVYFQGRESVNSFYIATPTIVQNAMDQFAELTGRSYHLFDYFGAPDAEHVIVIMGSGLQTAQEAVEKLVAQGEKVGVLGVRLYRPFAVEAFMEALPASVKSLAVMDRTKEPGSLGEPLYLDVVAALNQKKRTDIEVIGGRYGLSSKEFTPAMVKAVFDELDKDVPKNGFTLGINDDVTHTSLDYTPGFLGEDAETVRALFYGLGSDGTVGANKNSIKIIGDATDLYTQGYFEYDSKKSGSMTTSHLRFGPKPIKASYLIQEANFVACHQFSFLGKVDVLARAAEGATVLLACPHPTEEVWDYLPLSVQQTIIDKKLKVFTIDATTLAREVGMGNRINTIMQTCFFAISGILPKDEAIEAIKTAIKKTYGKRGESVVQKNIDAVDGSLANLNELKIPATTSAKEAAIDTLLDNAPDFVKRVTAPLMAGLGNDLPVSAMPIDGTFPTGTAKWEKRRIAAEVPVWDEDLCIQCGKCALVCPHTVIRTKLCTEQDLINAPEEFAAADAKWQGMTDKFFTLQISADDCTGCSLCVQVCPVKDKSEVKRKAINMADAEPLFDKSKKHWDYFLGLPEMARQDLKLNQVKDVQLIEPLFEFSGACAGCGETPYVKLMSQLFGDRALIANATGCSSIYGGNLPTTPWTTNADGRGPAWSNSLFEDNAEFGLGMRMAVDKQQAYGIELLKALSSSIGDAVVKAILENEQLDDEMINQQRETVKVLKEKLKGIDDPRATDLLAVADNLVKRSVWIVGGDGWAYDIGFGGLDHVMASPFNVNVLVLDTEVYSNTGGQASKATPRGAVAKFAAGGKAARKKDLALMMASYGNAYVARVAMGANDIHTLKALREAESYEGPSLVIAYSHCIAHGYSMVYGLEQQKKAVTSGHWPLFRYDPRLEEQGKNPFQLDCKKPTLPLKDYIYNETRYSMLARSNPDAAKVLLAQAENDIAETWKTYEYMASLPGNPTDKE